MSNLAPDNPLHASGHERAPEDLRLPQLEAREIAATLARLINGLREHAALDIDADLDHRSAVHRRIESELARCALEIGGAKLHCGSVIGFGSHGVVLSAERIVPGANPLPVALKLMPTDHVDGDHHGYDDFERELTALQRLDGLSGRTPKQYGAAVIRASSSVISAGIIVMDRLHGAQFEDHVNGVISRGEPIGEIAVCWREALSTLAAITNRGVVPHEYTDFNLMLSLAPDGRAQAAMAYDFARSHLVADPKAKGSAFLDAVDRWLEDCSPALVADSYAESYPGVSDLPKMMLAIERQLVGLKKGSFGLEMALNGLTSVAQSYSRRPAA